MTPAEYDAWYRTPRGSWIGETEFSLLREMLDAPQGASALDVGCGTGYFTRRLASGGFGVTGIDASVEMIGHARTQSAHGEPYLVGDARCLPFPDRHFDFCIAIASLCFIYEEEQALAEMVRVTRRRVAVGLLNRHSLLYRQKGRQGGRGAYRGARWHTAREAALLLARANLQGVVIRSGVFMPSGGPVAQWVEGIVPRDLHLGGILIAVGDIQSP